MSLLEAAWLMVPLAIYVGLVGGMTLRADRTIPRRFKSLPWRFNWLCNRASIGSRRFSLWRFPVLDGVLGLIILAIDIRFAVTGPHLHSLSARVFAIALPLLLFAVLQFLMLWMIRRWVRRAQARRADRHRGRRAQLRTDAAPAIPPAT